MEVPISLLFYILHLNITSISNWFFCMVWIRGWGFSYIYVSIHIYMCLCINIWISHCSSAVYWRHFPFLIKLPCVCLVTQSCPTLCDFIDCSLPGSSVHEDSLGKNTGVGCHALLQRIFPTQGLDQGLNVREMTYFFKPHELIFAGFKVLFCSFLTSLSLPRIEKSGALLWIKGM